MVKYNFGPIIATAEEKVQLKWKATEFANSVAMRHNYYFGKNKPIIIRVYDITTPYMIDELQKMGFVVQKEWYIQ